MGQHCSADIDLPLNIGEHNFSCYFDNKELFSMELWLLGREEYAAVYKCSFPSPPFSRSSFLLDVS
jgi:hypothetical protein